MVKPIILAINSAQPDKDISLHISIFLSAKYKFRLTENNKNIKSIKNYCKLKNIEINKDIY
ncbi:hypothetical protein BHC56_02255 [Snodgrassella alvi]|nr:hypothetical protein BHC56_02255 [Snodgrassella alvi]